MPRVYDDKWFEKQLNDYPPEHYRMTFAELAGILFNSDDICFTMAACYNYGFRRGRNYEKNTGKRKRGGQR